MQRTRLISRRGATFVEFAIVAPIFFAVVIGLVSAVTYVFETQIANQSAQAAARWGVAAANFAPGDPTATPPVAPAPQCPATPAPAGMLQAASAAAGPLAGSLQLVDEAAPAEAGVTSGGPGSGCEILVTVPYVGFGGFFGLGPTTITGTAIDLVS